MESHGDHITILPKNAKIYGYSDNTKVEIFGIDENVLCT